MNKLNIHDSWDRFIIPVLNTKESEVLLENLGESFHPSKENIFRAFSIPMSSVKLVIVGQDVYPDKNLATGIAFGVPEGKDSQSLRVIRKELLRTYVDDLTSPAFLETEEFVNTHFDNTMQFWVDQGILMLNSALTCNGKPGDQWDIWQPFMSLLFKMLDNNLKCPFIFLGKKAQTLGKLVVRNTVNNFPHPAADAYGKPIFYGCGIFTEIDKLTNNKLEWIKSNTAYPWLTQGLPF